MPNICSSIAILKSLAQHFLSVFQIQNDAFNDVLVYNLRLLGSCASTDIATNHSKAYQMLVTTNEKHTQANAVTIAATTIIDLITL